jgi:hypothetical protein
MRAIRITLFASLIGFSASAVWAQYGLYGAPETLRVPQEPTPAAAPVEYPATETPTAQPAPVAVYAQPQPQYAYPVQSSTTYQPAPQYRYPAQPSATAMYQPYQAGAQYRYPGPYSRANVRTAAAEQPVPPMPAPPAMPGQQRLAPQPAPNYAAPQNAGVMNQMLADQSCNGGCYRGSVNQFEQSACGGDGCNLGGMCGACPWYAGVYGLILGRSEGRRVWTSYEDGVPTNQLTNTQFGTEWKWGGEVQFGRRFCCGCVPYAVEATFWTTEPLTGYRSTTCPGGAVSTPLELNPLTFGGVAAQNWFDGAQEHRLWRRDEFYNFEINLIREQLAWACDSPWDIGWSVGVRYFRFQDYLQFGSLAASGTGWGDLPATAYFSDTITNNLVGAQFGFDAAYCVGGGFRVFIAPQVGIYNNFLETDFEARTGDGVNGLGPYGSYPVHSTLNGLAFLTQIDIGADWQFSRNWSARVGYRVVAVTGMGLADDQFPQYMVDTPDIANIQHCSSLVLHGAFFGVTYNF